jgi:DNA-binding response OmpR family regulator
MKVLLGDTDTDLLGWLAHSLRDGGFTVSTATDGEAALQRWQADQPDLVVLEVDLPGRSGLDVCRWIRESGSTPVILMSAQTTDARVVEGFRAGADDYVGKPIRPRELALRIRAVWRQVAQAAAHVAQQVVRVAGLDLVLDPETHEVRRGNSAFYLTPLEFRLLHRLASNAGRVVPTQQLIQFAWGNEGGGAVALKTHIMHIRQKLGLPRQGAGSLSAVRGIGYRLQR